jgi:hypothetical protein
LQENSDIENIRTFLFAISLKSVNVLLNEEILKSLDSLSHIFKHKEFAKRQRGSYQFMKENLKSDELLIEMDYKQKVCLRFFN